mgnify:CR=1 FL=1|jgi:hypothetical protein
MSKEKEGFFDKLKKDLFTGFNRIVISLKEGFILVGKNLLLISKFIFFSLIITLISGFFIESYFMISIGLVLLSFSFLILLFHHEFFGNQIKSRTRFVKNVIFMFFLLVLMTFLFSFNPDPDPDISASHPAKIISSSLAFLILILFLFQSIYLVKSGAGLKIALKSSFNFLGKFGMSTMFYVLLLVFMFALSTIPSFFGFLFVFLSVIMFFGTIYVMFILLYVFWKNAKG